MSGCDHEPKILINWVADETLQQGMCAYFEFNEIRATALIDQRQSPREVLAAVFHELIEIVDHAEGLRLEHPEVHNKLAYPIADLLLAHGFNPFCLFTPQRDDSAQGMD